MTPCSGHPGILCYIGCTGAMALYPRTGSYYDSLGFYATELCIEAWALYPSTVRDWQSYYDVLGYSSLGCAGAEALYPRTVPGTG